MLQDLGSEGIRFTYQIGDDKHAFATIAVIVLVVARSVIARGIVSIITSIMVMIVRRRFAMLQCGVAVMLTPLAYDTLVKGAATPAPGPQVNQNGR